MENRERDRVSQRDSSTKKPVNEDRQKSGTNAEFGKDVGRSENLSEDEGGTMRNKNDKLGSNMENESGRRSGSGSFESQTGRSGSTSRPISNVDRSSGSDIKNDESSRRSDNGKPGSSGWNDEDRH